MRPLARTESYWKESDDHGKMQKVFSAEKKGWLRILFVAWEFRFRYLSETQWQKKGEYGYDLLGAISGT